MSNESFLGMLAESPFSGLQEHMILGNKSPNALENFLKAVSESDWRTAFECREEIVTLENQADDIKNNIRNNLPKSLFMSVSRQDLLDLVFTMDGIPNAAKDISGVMIGRKMELPKEVAQKVSKVYGVGEVEVKLVWEPAWTKDRMSEDSKLLLGID